LLSGELTVDFEERKKAFVQKVKEKIDADENWKIAELFGVSNRSLPIKNALQVAVANMESYREGMKGIAINSLIRFPPFEEVYLSVVAHDYNSLFQRLKKMLREASSFKQDVAQATFLENIIDDLDDPDQSSTGKNKSAKSNKDIRNNNVVIYLAHDGNLYLRNNERSRNFLDEFSDEIRANYTPSIKVDKILFAVYPPKPSVTRSLLVRECIGYFVSLVGNDKVEEIQPWPDELDISPAMRQMPSDIPFAEIKKNVKDLGGHFVPGLLERYHVSLNHLQHKHFVILTGLSGTGKTTLAKLYSYAVHGVTKTGEDDPFFFVCSVRPDWTDPTGLVGYYDIVSGKYIVTPFLEAVLMAIAHRDTPVFVCIDEMNIAQAEFYFADVLSSMESRTKLHLHSNSVPLEGSRGEPVPDSIELPSNLFITGTINIDESTQPLSDKILDRANIIDMSHVDINGFLNNLKERYLDLAVSIETCSDLLTKLDNTLLPYGLGFGYRVIEEIIRYIAFVQRNSIMETKDALDSQITQKILVKLKGGEGQRELLKQLVRHLDTYPDSLKIVHNLQSQLEEYGSFQNLR
jgi:MoxR-like ATPase/23S rRNA maturation mini-RNase III